jgi:integrase
MACLFKRDGFYHVKWMENGRDRRKSLRTKSVQRARAMVIQIERNLAAGLPWDAADTDTSVTMEAFEARLEKDLAATRQPHTVKTLLHEWKHFRDWSGKLYLGEVQQQTVLDYKRHLLARGYEKSTVRSSLLALSSIFKVAVQELHLYRGENPCKGVGLPKADSRHVRFLDKDQLEALLTAAAEYGRDMHLIVALGCFAGLRKNELVNARWDWIDWNGRGAVSVKSQDGFRPKSGRDRRIPMNARLRPVLEEYKGDPDAYVVYPDLPTKPDKPTQYRVDFTDAFGSVCKAAGVDWVTPHTMRHTFASQLVIAGVSIYKVGKWLGHADVKTTQIYAHLAPDDADIDKL